MLRTHFPIPSILDLNAALNLSLILAQTEECEEFVFDFLNVQHVEPFAMLLVSSEMRRLAKRFPTSTMVYKNYRHMSYAGDMGFFQAFGVDFGSNSGVPRTNYSSNFPLKIFKCESIVSDANSKGIEVGDQVENESKQLAAMLCMSDQGDTYETLSYAIREMIRNVVERVIVKCCVRWHDQAATL